LAVAGVTTVEAVAEESDALAVAVEGFAVFVTRTGRGTPAGGRGGAGRAVLVAAPPARVAFFGAACPGPRDAADAVDVKKAAQRAPVVTSTTPTARRRVEVGDNCCS
jgi:hypothetical protein